MERYQVKDMLKYVIIQARLGDPEAKGILQEIEELSKEHEIEIQKS